MSAPIDAALTASLFAVDPCGLGGVCLRSLAQPARGQWLEVLRELLPGDGVMRRVPFNIADGRLLGGLDLAATLLTNRPVAERGILAAANGGVVVLTMAERLNPHTAALLNSVLDSGQVTLQREGVNIADVALIGVVALDESMGDDERVPASLLDRLAFLVDLGGYDLRTLIGRSHEPREIVEARRILPRVTLAPEVVEALCSTGMALGAGSPRVALLAMRAAKALAALDGRTQVDADDAATAARLVFAPRATQMPVEPQQAPEQRPPDQPQPQQPQSGPTPEQPGHPPDPSDGDEAQAQVPPNASPPPGALQDQVLAATIAAIPAGLLAGLRAESRSRPAAAGRAGALQTGGTRGRPSGVRAGAPHGRSRLNVLETLRVAAPWQRLRGRLNSGDRRVRIDPSDFRITRYRQHSPTLTIFAVDASGSSALNRLAEAKGAVELLLADCYVRRDQVAVVSFRGRAAELLLPPTRSLVRAKRSLAGLPGGGGTPLAAGIQCAMLLAVQSQRRGETPTVVLLSDGRANVSRDGAGGRERAHAEAMQTGRVLRRTLISVLFVDTSPRPNSQARELAVAMGARYIPLPFANARAVSSIVTAATEYRMR